MMNNSRISLKLAAGTVSACRRHVLLQPRQVATVAKACSSRQISRHRARLLPSVVSPSIICPSSTAYSKRFLATSSAEAEPEPSQQEEKDDDSHSIIKEGVETVNRASTDKHDFVAETKMLLDIVANSLYSEKEVFIRELISNASDALEKLRYMRVVESKGLGGDSPLEVHISVDKGKRQFIIQDTGIGMSKEEMVKNLGTIARSGSKEFLQSLAQAGSGTSPASNSAIIGKFGVGFYSAFMVADKVTVFSRSHEDGAKGYRWISDGSGSYEIAEADGVEPGTKIVLKLKPGDAINFGDNTMVEAVIKKYSNFVSSPIFLNGKQINKQLAIWTMPPKDVTSEMHDEFFRFIMHRESGRPRYCLQYRADVPVQANALIYIPEEPPSLFHLEQTSSDVAIALYSRKVLVQSKANDIVPKWMRFCVGVIDSEDIPLNLSRELLQKSAVISKLRQVIKARVIKFLAEQMKKDLEKYEGFYKDYSVFLKEGILTTMDQSEKEDIAKLLLFESSSKREGVKVSLADYAERMQAGQRDVYYLAAPSRELAESSPYYESVKSKGLEVLFCYEPYDELVLIQLGQFDRKVLTSVEKYVRQDSAAESGEKKEQTMTKQDADALTEWIRQTLGPKVHEVKITDKLTSYPCMLTVEEMGAARHYVRTQFANIPESQRYLLLRPTMELNVEHPVTKTLLELKDSDTELAGKILTQMYDNALVAAGLMQDPRSMVAGLNDLLTSLVLKIK